METPQTTTEIHLAQKDKLLRILGVTFGLAVVTGGMIGTGILRTPGAVAGHLQTPWLIILVWILAGIYALIGANTYAELGTMLPRAGGPYVFARQTYGEFGGFLVGWSDWFVNVLGISYYVVAIGEYSAALVPLLNNYVSGVSIFTLLVLGAFHRIGLRAGSGLQKLTSLLKVLAFFVIIAACFIFGGKQTAVAAERTTAHLISNPMTSFVAVVLALQMVMETYAGWNGAVYFTEEDKNPSHNIPRALFGGVFIVMAIYVLFNLAIIYVLPIPTLAASKLPAADAAQAVFGGASGQIITALALVSLLSILNGALLITPRIMFAMSRGGLFSERGATVNTGGTPTVALALTVLIAMILAASATFESLFSIAAFMGVAIDCSIFATLFILRKREPDLPRPYLARGYPFVPMIILVGSVLLLVAYVISNTVNSLLALTVMAMSYPIYRLIRR